MAREDFVKVRLTEHGERVAQGHAVNVASGNQYFTFHPGETRDDITRVLDWEKCLKDVRLQDGLMFELVEDDESSAPSASLRAGVGRRSSAGSTE
jgi:hypothetical protein